MRAVLTYHSIDRSGSVISVTPEAFRAHVEWLERDQVRVVPLAELLTLDDHVDAVALTFDDGLATVAAEAAPTLAAHGWPATVFVVSRHAGTDNRWNGSVDRSIPPQQVLGWHDLARLQQQGFAIGAHTRHHRHLRACSDTELHDELGGCADDIAAALGDRPRAFAYPYGDVDARIAGAASTTFPVCCTTEFRVVESGSHPALLPRLDAWYFRDPARLPRWGSRRFRRSIAIRHTLRRIRRGWQ